MPSVTDVENHSLADAAGYMGRSLVEEVAQVGAEEGEDA